MFYVFLIVFFYVDGRFIQLEAFCCLLSNAVELMIFFFMFVIFLYGLLTICCCYYWLVGRLVNLCFYLLLLPTSESLT